MRIVTTLLAISLISTNALPQSISQVLFNPNNITECDQVVMTMVGTVPNGSYMVTNFTANVNGSVITFQMNANGNGSGGGVGFNQASTAVGPWPVGTYTFNAELLLNGDSTPVATWSTTITVSPGQVPDPGFDTFITICNSDPSFNLVGALDGSPDSWGQWIDPNGVDHGNTFNPGTDPGGVWIYEFDQGGPCVDTSAQLFVTYEPNNSAGADTQAPVCVSGPPVDLFNLIDPSPSHGPTDPIGTWTAPGGGVFSGIFTPGTDQTGIYTYTVTGQAPCGNPSSQMIVSLASPGNAGVGSPAMVCEDDTAALLWSNISGTNDTTGTWYDPFGFPMPNLHLATFNATADFVGVYSYVVDVPPCVADTASVDVSLIPPCFIGIEEVKPSIARMDLVPNPANDQVEVLFQLSSPSTSLQLELLTITGILVDSKNVAAGVRQLRKETLDLSDVPNGSYFIRLRSDKGSVVRKLVKH